MEPTGLSEEESRAGAWGSTGGGRMGGRDGCLSGGSGEGNDWR